MFQSYLQLLAGFCQLVWVNKYEDVIVAAIERQAIVVCLKFEVLVEFSTHRGSVSDLLNPAQRLDQHDLSTAGDQSVPFKPMIRGSRPELLFNWMLLLAFC